MPTEAQAVSFYRAALAAARHIDRDSDHRVFSADADAAFRAYGGDLPTAVRCDLVLRNFAMLYPAAFAPGPVFDLAGWHEDDPWGADFGPFEARVAGDAFAGATSAERAIDALDAGLAAWGAGGEGRAEVPAIAARVSPGVSLVVAGARAVAAIARVFVGGERLSWRAQVVVVSAAPEARHAAGIACALLGERGVPPFVEMDRRGDEAIDAWAAREAKRLGAGRAQLLVISPDAAPGEIECARAIAARLGAAETIEISGS